MDLTIDRAYVERRGGGLWVAGTRVSLDSIVHAYRQGCSPEGIADNYPAVTQAQIYGAIAFYLAHRAEVDTYLQEGDALADALRRESRQKNAVLHDELEVARNRQSAS